MEKTLNTVEGRLDEVAQYSVPLYENYVYPTADRFIGYYSKGKINQILTQIKQPFLYVQ